LGRSERWVELKVTVSAESADAVAERLVGLGAGGCAVKEEEDGRVRTLTAYFPADDRAGERLKDLRAFLERLPDWGLDPGPGDMTARPVEEAEWRDQWKAYFRPRRVGRRFVVHPPWEKPGADLLRPVPGRTAAGPVVTLEIDPTRAFGTGTHPTTVGALELLERAAGMLREAGRGQEPDSLEALDLGTGSGILAIAAARVGFSRVTAVDCDPAAVEAARENVRRNGVDAVVEVVEGDALAVAGRLAADGAPRRVHLVLANITTDTAAALAAPVASLLAEGGFFVCSGVSSGEGARRVLGLARRAGLVEVERRAAEGWTSFLFRKGRSAESRRTPSAETHGSPTREGAREPAVETCPPPATRACPPAGAGAPTTPPGRRRRRPTALFHTLGCKANLYDTAVMMEALRAAGWRVIAPDQERALAGDVDLVVVNSCAVTARAEAKTRQLTRKLRREHPGAVVALVGCYPQVDREGAARRTGADLILGTEERARLPELAAERVGGRVGRAGQDEAGVCPAAAARETRAPEPRVAGVAPGAFAGERTRATVKVQDGCEQFCTYCIIPYARGPSRSRPAEEVLREVGELVAAGFKEVVLTGIHLGAWGLDQKGPEGGSRLADLVRRVASVPGLARVRLSSIEPLEVTDELIELMATDPRVCRHLHVPLQSGSDAVLEKMNRHYTAEQYLAMVERVRARVPEVGLTTDVMVGFPGETDDDFEATLDVVRRARFSRLHVFRFSRRPGTPAADMPGQVAPAVKKARSARLIRLGRRLAREFHESLLGMVLEVLVEHVGPEAGESAHGRAGRGRARLEQVLCAEGLTDNYVRVSFPSGGAEPNDLVPVLLERAESEGVVGRRK